MIHITKHGGKMEHIPSINTSCLCNPICQERAKDKDSICSHCYAARYLTYRKNLPEALERNYNLLTQSILDQSDLPIFYNTKYVRIESMGDVATVTQALNYINICKVNKGVKFAAWTKNLSIWKAAFKQVGKPKNLSFVLSSPYLNSIVEDDEFVDHIFTVYDKSHAENINCGAKKCITCLKCYKRGGEKYINELLK